MANVKKTSIRGIRKSAHISYKLLAKGANFSAKVEDKATRIITGKDYSMLLDSSVPVEKALYNGISYNISPLNPALPAVGRPGKITILIPSLNKKSFFGGTATALIVAAKLAQKVDMPLRIVETLQPGGKDGLGDFLESNDIHLAEDVELIDVSARTHNIYGYIDLHPDDIFLASAWWDAKLISQLPLTRKFIYLIQDFEPIFYSNSDEYVFANQTYHSEAFIPICNTRLMLEFMESKGYKYIAQNGLYFEPAVSRKKYGLSEERRSKRRLFLYGRPSVARNLFYTAISALNDVFDSGKLDANDWEIFMAGQDKLPNITLSTGVEVQNLGKLSMDDYSNFIRTVDIALSPMMAPHPNYPTLEFASVGAAVVTTKYETKQTLDRYSKNIIMADLSIEDIAKSIVKASKLTYSQRLENEKSNIIGDDWDVALNKSLSEAVQLLGIKVTQKK